MKRRLAAILAADVVGYSRLSFESAWPFMKGIKTQSMCLT